MADVRKLTPQGPAAPPGRVADGAPVETGPRPADLFTDSFSFRGVREAVSQVAETGTRWLSKPIEALGDLVEKIRSMFWFSNALEMGRRAETDRRKRQDEKKEAEAEEARREAAIQRAKAEERDPEF